MTQFNRETRSFDARLLLVILAGVIVALPCLIYGFPYYGDDSVSNAILAKQFSDQFWSGECYPRWLEALNGGLGDPTGFYYPPMAYWITSLLKFFSRNDPYGWHQLGISAVVAVVASGVVVFFWLRKSVGPPAALLASLLYLILPYHLNIDLYVRGTVAELWSFVWMPLVICAVEAICARKRFGVVGLSVAYALLVMTHLPTTLMFSFIPIAYSFFVANRGERVRSFVLTAASMLLGVGLSAIYLAPAMMKQDFVFLTTQGIGSHYYFGNWFLFSKLRWAGFGSEYFFAATSVLFVAVAAFFVAYRRTDVHKTSASFWFVVAVCCFLMMTPLSKTIWQLIPSLQKIQFPFRFNTVLSIAVTPLIASAYLRSSRKPRLIFLATIVVFASLWIYSTARRAFDSYPTHYLDQQVVESTDKRLSQRRDTNELRPRWVVSIEESDLDFLLEHIGETRGDLNKVNVVSGDASVDVKSWTPRRIDLHVDSKDGAVLNLSRFYFPGWSAQIDSAPAIAVQPSKPGGLIRIVVPSGQHGITVQLERRKPEVAGQLISGVSLVLVIALFGAGLMRGYGPRVASPA